MDFIILKNVGIDTDSAVERFMGNETLYAKMLKKFVDDNTFSSLLKAVAEDRKKDALDISHSLKGICGNLSLDLLYKLLSDQVTLMRNEQWEEAFGLMPEITESYNQIMETIRKWTELQ